MSDTYIKDTQLTVEQVINNLKVAVAEHQFGILHTYNIAQILASKGQNLDEECHVFEVCNPKIAKQILDKDMSLASVLPCRISVYTKQGQVKIGMALPAKHVQHLSNVPGLSALIETVEQQLIGIIDQSITE